jgi:biotin carboxyl carrier protein
MGLDEREPADRLADHAAIDTLADELIPALIAKLGASGLGEIEVREGDWKVRLRRPADGVAQGSGRRAGERPGRSGTAAPQARSALTPVGPGRVAGGLAEEAEPRQPGESAGAAAGDATARGRDPFRAMATAPAVGFYQPRSGVVPGSRVRAGDPIGAIDVLGIPTEVVAPADGIVGASLVEPGEAVEYGQELVWVELLSAAPASPDGTGGAPGAPGEP